MYRLLFSALESRENPDTSSNLSNAQPTEHLAPKSRVEAFDAPVNKTDRTVQNQLLVWPPIATNCTLTNQQALQSLREVLLNTGSAELCEGLSAMILKMCSHASLQSLCSDTDAALSFLRYVPTSVNLLSELEHLPLWLRLGAARCVFETERSPSSHLQAAIQAPYSSTLSTPLNLAFMMQVKASSDKDSCVALLNAGLVSSAPETRAAAYRMAGSLANLSIPLGRRALAILMKRCLGFESSDIALAAGIAVICELPSAAAVTSTQLRKWTALMLPKLRGSLKAQGQTHCGFLRSFAVLAYGICQWCLLRLWSPAQDADMCLLLLLRHVMSHQITSIHQWQMNAKAIGREGLSSWTLTTPLSIVLQALQAPPDEYSTQALLCRCLIRLGASVLSLNQGLVQHASDQAIVPTDTPAEQQSALLCLWCGPALPLTAGTQPSLHAVNVCLVRMLASLLSHAWLLAACDEWKEAGHDCEGCGLDRVVEPLTLLNKAMQL